MRPSAARRRQAGISRRQRSKIDLQDGGALGFSGHATAGAMLKVAISCF